MQAGGSLQYVVFKKHCVTLVKSRTKMLPHPYCRRIPAAAIWDIRTGKPKAFHPVSDHADPWTADDRITVRTGLYPCLFHHIAGGAAADVQLSRRLLRRSLDPSAIFSRKDAGNHGTAAICVLAECSFADLRREHEQL